MDPLLDVDWFYLLLAAFGGGAFGAALGALPAFAFTGVMVIAGEAATLAGQALGPETTIPVTGAVAFGPVFGPHISFAGGAAAAAYAAKQGYMDTGFDFHMAKDITYAHGPKVDVLAVGGVFGILGAIIRQVSEGFGLPWDPIAMGVVLSALFHRLLLGFPVIGTVRGTGIFDMTPFDRGDRRESVAGDSSRFVVEPWLPHQYRWGEVAAVGGVTGLLGAYIAIETGSPFLAFGISAASLLFLNLGVARIPVTHHMTLPASTAAMAVVATGAGVEPALLAGASETVALLVGGGFGVVCALFGEVVQRVFYAHADTHWDPPATAIVFGTFLVALFKLAGIFGTTVWVPLP